MEFIVGIVSLFSSLFVPEYQINPVVEVQTYCLRFKQLPMSFDEVITWIKILNYAFEKPSGSYTLFTFLELCWIPNSNLSELIKNSGK